MFLRAGRIAARLARVMYRYRDFHQIERMAIHSDGGIDIRLAGVKVREVQKISLISCARLLVATGPPGTRRALLMAADPAPRRARSMRARGYFEYFESEIDSD